MVVLDFVLAVLDLMQPGAVAVIGEGLGAGGDSVRDGQVGHAKEGVVLALQRDAEQRSG